MAESAEFELEAEELMMSSSLDNLVKLADDLGIDKKFWEAKPKVVVIKSIRKSFDVDDVEEKKKMLDLIVKSLQQVVTTGSLTGSSEALPSNEENPSFNALINNSMFRRELKIQGQIGEAYQRDKISFISLMRQIREAKAKGYDEQEITSAILRAFTPGLSLRTYLETVLDLTLPRLLQILRTHFKEKSATELYKELSTMTQEQAEDANKFLIRALEVRQKVLFASETDEGVHYNPTLVQGLFLQNQRLGTNQRKQENEFTRCLLNQWNRLYLDENEILRRKIRDQSQLVLPANLRSLIYQELHDKMGHLGVDRVTHLARERVFWPKMESDIEHYVTKVCRCLKQRRPHQKKRAPLQSITSSSPMDLISIDFVHLETSSGGYEYILTIVDHFSRYLQAYATKDKSAKTAARHLYQDFIPRFGIPARLLHDQGKEFENGLFHHLEKLCGITRSRTTPYHPETNGQCERMNQTIISMLRTLEESQKSRWRDSLNHLVHAYNCTRNSSTGFSPYYLLFGREPRLPIDLILQTKLPPKTISHSQYLRNMQASMNEAYQIASRKSDQRKASDRIRRNSNAITHRLEIGDRVLIRNVGEKGGPGKLRSFWEQEVYTVVDCKGDSGVVYSVRPENNEKGRIRTVHRNMLLPCEHLSSESTERNNIQKNDKGVERGQANKGKTKKIDQSKITNASATSAEDNSRDDADDFEGFYPNTLNELGNSRVETNQAIEQQTENDPTLESSEPEPGSENSDNLSENSDTNTEVHNVRPQRERRPPQILTYYGPGQSFDLSARDVSSINATSQPLPEQRMHYQSYPNAYTRLNPTPMFGDPNQAYFRPNPVNFNFRPPFMYPVLRFPVQYQQCF